MRERTGWSNRQIRHALVQLTDYELLVQKGSGQGRLALYRLYDAPDANLSATCPALSRPERKSAAPSLSAASAAELLTFPLSRPGERSGQAPAAA